MGQVDSKVAEEIEKDVEEIDASTSKSKVAQSKKAESTDDTELVDCECVETGWKPGLLSDSELCPKCQGTGKVAELTEG